MLATTIKHGDLVIDMNSDGSVQVTRQSDMMAIRLSLSEWNYLVMIAGIHGWPVAPPDNIAREAIP